MYAWGASKIAVEAPAAYQIYELAMQENSASAKNNAPREGSPLALAIYAFFGVAIIVIGLFVLRAQMTGDHFEMSGPMLDFSDETREGAALSPVDLPPVQPPAEALSEGEEQATHEPTSVRVMATAQDRAIDMDALLTAMLVQLGQPKAASQPLRDRLSMTLEQGRSDAYIDTFLNAAITRGDIEPPLALTTVAGRLDTDTLLETLVLATDSFETAAHRAFASARPHELRPTDSFAGLSLHYYGHPLAHDLIAGANEDRASLADAEVGQVVSIPAF